MTTSIIDLSNKRPRAFVRVSLGTGPRASGAAPITILLIGNKSASAPTNPMTNDTIEQVFDEDTVIARTGAGSELHRMYRRVTKINQGASIYIGAMAASAGAQATHTTTFTGTATADSTLEVTIGGDEPLQIAIANGDTAATVRAAIISRVNSVIHTPVIASESTNDVVLTAKHTGPRGNMIRVRTRWVDGTGAGLTVTTIAPDGANLSSGATNDSPTNVLAASVAVRFHLTVVGYSTVAEATPIGVLTAHIDDSAEPLTGKRGRLILGCVSALATAQTFAFTNVNEERGQIAYAQVANETPAELAAALAARIALGLASDRATNFDGVKLAGITQQWAHGDRLTETEITSALNNGLTPIAASGTDMVIVRSITSKSRTAAGGAVFDYAVLDTHYVDVPDFIADTIEENFAAAFPNAKLGVDIEGEMPPPGVATANTVRAWCLGLVAPFENDLLENFDAVTLAGSRFTRNEVAKGRIDAVLPLDVIELFHQFAVDVRQQG